MNTTACWLLRGLTLASALALTSVGAQPGLDTRRSGFDDMGAATQAMQRDDSQNPAMLWLKDGEALWATPPTPSRQANAKTCLGCHASAESSMRGVASRYPAFDNGLNRPVNLTQRINLCRERHQGAPPWAPESQALLSLETWVAYQSRGMPIAPPTDARLAPFMARGATLFNQRIGQLDLSCAQCHDQYAGRRLGGSLIPQGHPTAYPLYRLEWQALGSLTRRLRACMTGVRAEPLAAHSVGMVELELFLASRAMGMPLETPGVRP